MRKKSIGRQDRAGERRAGKIPASIGIGDKVDLVGRRRCAESLVDLRQ
jgi:hypothetical protein